jgi:hypothetical protein
VYRNFGFALSEQIRQQILFATFVPNCNKIQCSYKGIETSDTAAVLALLKPVKWLAKLIANF